MADNVILRKKVVSLIEQYLQETINYQELIDFLPDERLIVQDSLLSEVVHLIGHYDDDDDIISVDITYKKYMNDQISSLIRKMG